MLKMKCIFSVVCNISIVLSLTLFLNVITYFIGSSTPAVGFESNFLGTIFAGAQGSWTNDDCFLLIFSNTCALQNWGSIYSSVWK